MAIFVCPALMDVILFAIGNAIPYVAGGRLTPGQIAWLTGINAAAYMVGSPISGLILKRKNALPAFLVATIISVLAAVVCLTFPGFWPIFFGMAVLGLFAALFYNSFQTVMRGDAPPGGLARVTALYLIAWSVGAGTGNLLSGSLLKIGQKTLAGAIVAIGLAMLVTVLMHKPRPESEMSADEHTDGAGTEEQRLHTPYVWIGWLMIFIVAYVQRPIITYYSAHGGKENWAPILVALPLGLHLLLQAGSGFAMPFARKWLYRVGPIIAFHVAAIAALLILWLSNSRLFSGIVIVLLGIWAAFGYFSAGYYAANSGHRSRNVGVNETLVGVGTAVGLFVLARVLERYDNFNLIYLVLSASVALVLIIQWAIAAKAGAKAATSPAVANND